MPQIHANLSKEASHGWNGLAIKLGVSTSGLLEAVGQLLADETRPGQETFYEELADRARTIDAMRRQRKVRLLVPAGAGTAAIARVARVAIHRPIASASAGMLALGGIGGGVVIIDRAPGASSHVAAATSQWSDSQVPTARVLGDGPANVLPVPPPTPGVTTAPPTTATTTASPAAGSPAAASPATTATTTASPAAGSPAAASPATTATTTASPAAGSPAAASPPTSQPSASANAGPVSASVSAGGSGAQVNAQVPVVSAQAGVTPSSASVSAPTPVVSAKVSARTGAVSTVSSATSTVAGTVKRVAGSVLGG